MKDQNWESEKMLNDKSHENSELQEIFLQWISCCQKNTIRNPWLHCEEYTRDMNGMWRKACQDSFVWFPCAHVLMLVVSLSFPQCAWKCNIPTRELHLNFICSNHPNKHAFCFQGSFIKSNFVDQKNSSFTMKTWLLRTWKYLLSSWFFKSLYF